MERPGQRLAHRPPQPDRDAVAQLGGGTPAEGEDEDAFGIHSVAIDSIDNRFHQCRRLAGSRACENEQRPTPMLDNAALVGVQFQRRCGRSVGTHQAQIHVSHDPHLTMRH